MRFRNLACLIFLAAGMACVPLAAQAQGNDPVTTLNADEDDPVLGVDGDNRKMNAASAEARRTLPVFWDLLDTYPEYEGAFRLKAAFVTTDDSWEHIWMGDLSHDGDRITGTLMNQPLYLADPFQQGDTVTVHTADVSDWTITGEGDRDYGGFTLRVFASLIGGEEGAAMRETLQDKVIPPYADRSVLAALPPREDPR